MSCNHATDEFDLCVYRCDASIPNPLEAKPMTKTRYEIAYHIVYLCEGDNCHCCDWSDEDRALLQDMPFEEAENIINDADASLPFEDEGDRGPDDLSADAEALASAGWGTDEDCGYYGDE